MTIELASPAVAVARPQVQAWSNGWETARKSLAPDVHV